MFEFSVGFEVANNEFSTCLPVSTRWVPRTQATALAIAISMPLAPVAPLSGLRSRQQGVSASVGARHGGTTLTTCRRNDEGGGATTQNASTLSPRVAEENDGCEEEKENPVEAAGYLGRGRPQ